MISKLKIFFFAACLSLVFSLAGPPAHAFNLLLVSGTPQVVLVRLPGGKVVPAKIIADHDDAGDLCRIAPGAGE